MKKKIAIIAGGYSSEKEVSMRSARTVFRLLDNFLYQPYLVVIDRSQWVVLLDEKEYVIDKNDFSCLIGDETLHFDVAYIMIHGTPGEDGYLGAYFDLLQLPYTTCPAPISALTFNKYMCNRYLSAFSEQLSELHIAPALLFYKGKDKIEEITKSIKDKIGFPCFVKPNNGGSSFGISKVTDLEMVTQAMTLAFEESDEVVVEKMIEGVELTSGCYITSSKAVAFPLTEVVTNNPFFDYDAKYNGQVEEITPARISDELKERIQGLTLSIYRLLDCFGLIRIDYIVTAQNEIFLLEINTIPGMTETSFIPQQIRAAGMDVTAVLTEIIKEKEIK